MPNLFNTDIAGIMAKNLGPMLLKVTLTQLVTGDRIDGSLTSGPELTEKNYSGRGFIQDYADRQIDGTVVQIGDRKVLVLGKTLPSNVVPQLGDKITVEKSTYKIIRVTRDPAAATYTCQVRG